MNKFPSLNILSEPLQPCSIKPVTGFFRDGCCNTSVHDSGSHTVCVELSEEFLAYSKSVGNDLSTPRAEWGFPGLKPGQRWCLCAERWLEAYRANKAPRVYLQASHIECGKIIDVNILSKFALDTN